MENIKEEKNECIQPITITEAQWINYFENSHSETETADKHNIEQTDIRRDNRNNIKYSRKPVKKLNITKNPGSDN